MITKILTLSIFQEFNFWAILVTFSCWSSRNSNKSPLVTSAGLLFKTSLKMILYSYFEYFLESQYCSIKSPNWSKVEKIWIPRPLLRWVALKTQKFLPSKWEEDIDSWLEVKLFLLNANCCFFGRVRFIFWISELEFWCLNNFEISFWFYII